MCKNFGLWLVDLSGRLGQLGLGWGRCAARMTKSHVHASPRERTKVRGWALRATWETGGGARLRPRPAGRWRICVQARIRPRPRLSDALHRHPIWKPASRDRKSHGKGLKVSLSSELQPALGLPVKPSNCQTRQGLSKISCPAGTAGFPIRRGEESPFRAGARSWRRAGNLFTRPPAGPRPKPSKTAPRLAGFPGRAKRKQPEARRRGESTLKAVKAPSGTLKRESFQCRRSRFQWPSMFGPAGPAAIPVFRHSSNFAAQAAQLRAAGAQPRPPRKRPNLAPVGAQLRPPPGGPNFAPPGAHLWYH